jgi:hypothetical protein
MDVKLLWLVSLLLVGQERLGNIDLAIPQHSTSSQESLPQPTDMYFPSYKPQLLPSYKEVALEEWSLMLTRCGAVRTLRRVLRECD